MGVPGNGTARAPIPEYPPSGPFPIEETAIAPGPLDGDREAILARLLSGQTVDIIVEFEVSEVRDDIHRRAAEKGIRFLGEDLLAEKRLAYASTKLAGLAGLVGVVVLRDYENLPSSFVRVLNVAALNSLIARPEVKAVYENRVSQLFLSQSLPLIHQPEAATEGLGGAGTTIAVLDTGVNFTRPEFGSCTSPGIPMGCRVVDTFEAADNDFALDDFGHGTVVSSVVAQTAGAAQLAVADVVAPNGDILDADVDTAIDWAIAVRPSFNIVAMNLSLGRLGVYSPTGTCPSDPFAAPLAEALAAGIRPIAASGNAAIVNNVYQDGITAPACVPAAVSAGAAYDANVGGRTWSIPGHPEFTCSDATTAADKVTCFSQSASYLSLLAPGALITAGGAMNVGGTSFAAPHVAGAWAMLRAVSNASEARLLATLQEIGEPINDTRPSGGRTTSRLDLLPEPGQLAQLVAGFLVLSSLRSLRSLRARMGRTTSRPSAEAHLS